MKNASAFLIFFSLSSNGSLRRDVPFRLFLTRVATIRKLRPRVLSVGAAAATAATLASRVLACNKSGDGGKDAGGYSAFSAFPPLLVLQ